MRKKHLIGLAITCGITLLVVYTLYPYYTLLDPMNGIWTAALRAELPSETQIILHGLNETVEIFRDSWGVPYIYAKTEDDLFYAFGYVQAQDRLWQMDFHRRAAEGRLAEVLGKSLYQTDLFFRVAGLARAANATLQQLDQKTKRALNQFARGINLAVEDMERDNNLPIEFKLLGYEPDPWTPLDSVAFLKLLAWGLTGNFYDLEFQRFVDAFGPETANELFPIPRPCEVWIYPGNYTEGSEALSIEDSANRLGVLESRVLDVPNLEDGVDALLKWKADAEKWIAPFRSVLASNNWVVNGSRTTSGKPILCNDPHLELSAPPVWYEARLVVTNASGVALNVRGVTFPGIPLIVIGANKYLAWGFTNVGADVTDFYQYVWDSNGERYWYVDHWENVQQVNETILVKTDRGVENRTVSINMTRHGPIMERLGFKVAMRWSGHYPTLEARAVYRYNTAKNLSDFMAGLADFSVPAQNTVYADVYGNIAWWANGRFVNRTNVAGVDLRLPFNGSRGEGEWSQDWIDPPNEVPHVINPPWGFVVTANNRPAGPTYPFWLGWTWAEHYRAQRILELVNVTRKIDVDYMKTVQNDVLCIPARELTSYIIEAYERSSLEDEDVAEAVDSLRNWNYIMDEDEVAPAVFATWLENLQKNTFEDDYKHVGFDGPYPPVEVLEYLVKHNASRWFDRVNTVQTETRDAIILESLELAVEALLKKGASFPEWGVIHQVEVRHPLGTALPWLNYPARPIDGWDQTVRPAGGLKVHHSASWRQIIDLSNLNSSVSVMLGGQRGNPLSKHYYDQFELWLSGQYKPMTFPDTPDEAQVNAESKVTFRPERP